MFRFFFRNRGKRKEKKNEHFILISTTNSRSPLHNPAERTVIFLFLLSRVLVVFRLGPLLPLAQVAGISTRNTEFPKHISGLLGIGNGALGEDSAAGGVVDGEGVSNRPELLGLSSDIGCGVTLLDLSDLAGEEDQLRLVLGEAGDVGLEGLDRGVAAAVVDGDSNGESELAGDLGLLGGGLATIPNFICPNSSGVPFNRSPLIRSPNPAPTRVSTITQRQR